MRRVRGNEPDNEGGAGLDPLGVSRRRMLVVGSLALASSLVIIRLGMLPLPHDRTFAAVLYLMWSANGEQRWIAALALLGLTVVTTALSLGLTAWAIVWPARGSPTSRRLVAWMYRYALVWPALLFISTLLGRFIANVVYTIALLQQLDFTPLLASLEGSALEWIQSTLYAEGLSRAFAHLYSWVWMLASVGFGPWLAIRDKAAPVSHAVVGTILLATLAIPFFVAVPIVDPWATSVLYGYHGAGATAIQYLYPSADPDVLRDIGRDMRWAAGSCLPSLHVAFPLLYGMIAARHGLRWAAMGWATVAGGTAIGVVYLGRHWIVDVILAVPFSVGVHWLVRRWDPSLVLPCPGCLPGGQASDARSRVEA